ncbi:MAG TPA: hypothetical protein VF034_09480 [Gemmatimonadaceae bacterium]
MRDLHHDQSSTPYAGNDRRGARARELSAIADSWPPNRRVTDGPVALIADDIRRRLAFICDGWSEPEFEALVQRIARMKVRWMQVDRAD